MRIYLTHCTGIKDNKLKETGIEVTPDHLYTSIPIQKFIEKCMIKKVNWAIFSDHYGVWFPTIKHKWYDKPPDDVSDNEFKNLLNNFDQNLKEYNEIWFYNNPAWMHALYKKLLKKSRLNGKIKEFTHLREIS
ncbi:MAG: hypothetical protein COC01_09540 [Bacteroidetes bacterium]|nr:MAG: hypothetical protein COC01_09540 [Bacteroidota bacterium]